MQRTRQTTAEVQAFIQLYHYYLAQPEVRTGRTAYARANADVHAQSGRHRYQTYESFRTVLWRHNRRRRLARQRLSTHKY